MTKRKFDIAVSLICLITMVPLLILIAILIKVDSPGPILFTQRRLGQNRRSFFVYKFRSMHDRGNPDEIDQIAEGVLTSGEDARITRFGRLLRSTSLDELPQLFNILRGEMSIVGPRPILQEQADAVPEEFASRFELRPGLTGLAQVRGRRSLGWLAQLAADVEYVRKHGFLYDLGIILRTVYVILTRKGVYGGEAENWRAYRDRLQRERIDASLDREQGS